VDAGALFNPVPSWYRRLEYPHLGSKGYIGSTYLQENPLPWYVTPPVVSIRDVADRAIEMYTGRPLMKYDSLQYEPEGAPAGGRYNTVSVPVPAPALRLEYTRAAAEVLPQDARYFDNGGYSILDVESNLGDIVAYAVLSVDQDGGKSGRTNLTIHETQAPPAESLGKVYVVPNPLVVTSGLSGADPGGDIADRVQFMGLTSRCTIRIYSYTGQLVQTIEHDRDSFGDPWYQLTFNNQVVASGVYYFVVEDHVTGDTANGKFVVIH
jgi:hypothetical protein